MSSENPRAFGIGADKRIQRQTGVSDSDAARIAATEMDGANETRSGNIDSRQTYCGTLRYDENLPPSRGALEGRDSTLKSAAAELGIRTDGMTPNQIQDAIDEAVNKRWGI